jgi:glutathione S-transferase
MEGTKLTIGYWKIRGLISPVKYILEYLGKEYNAVDYEQGDGPEFSRESWLQVKPNLGLDFPNLPYLLDGDVKITESSAMLRYIANKYGDQSFSGKNAKDKAIVDMMYGVVSDIKSAVGPHMYGTGDKNAVIEISKRME